MSRCIDAFDTIVVPARDQSFQEQFIEGKCWYPLTIATNRISRIKYIAIYRVLPHSSITNVAEVERIEPYKLRYHSYIIHLKPDSLQKLTRPVPIKDIKRAIQSPRYTKLEMIYNADTIDDLW